MVTFSAALRHVKEQAEQCLPEQLIFQTCRDVGHRWRDRVLNPALTIHLHLLQLLAKVSLRGVRRVSNVAVSAQALCAARMRLSVMLLHTLVERSVPDIAAATTYKKHRVFIADGLGFTVADTDELARKYGKHKNQRGTSRGYPAPKFLALMQAGSGFIRKAIILPWSRQEFTCLSRLFKWLAPGDLLLGDRGLVSFVHLVLLRKRKLHACMRLPRGHVFFAGGNPLHRAKRKPGGKKPGGRSKAPSTRRLQQRLGRQDLLVNWTASSRPKWLAKRHWTHIRKETLTLRQIAFRIIRKGYPTQWAWLITTLLDPTEYPAQELVELYGQRWEVEVRFRDLKQTLGMKKISAKTVAGVQKEVLTFILLYNLVCQVIAQAARNQGVPPDRISFIDAARWLLYAAPGEILPALEINPRRKRKSQPRRTKNARHRYPQLTQSRAEACRPAYEAKI
jgi:hypothetical protein